VLVLIIVVTALGAASFLLAGAAFLQQRGIASRLAEAQGALMALEPALRAESKVARDELREILAGQNQALEGRFVAFGQTQSEGQRLVEERLTGFATTQAEQLTALRREAVEGRTAQEAALKERTDAFAETQTKRLGETNAAMTALAERLEKAQAESRQALKEALEAVTAQIKAMTESNEKRHDAIREALTQSLEAVRKDNETKLEAMRATVEEKLQGTLEQRLGESFKLVSERLEQVHKGLGEMQSLATGVGDLKRVLTNVKSRGGWGEVQLGILLEDMLLPDQYAQNVRIKPDSGEMVEFAVRLPGKGDGPPVFLPIDAKFPQEDYDRLLAAQDAGGAEEVEKAGAALERAIRAEAKRICEKYVCPPHSTDFAIMYLPTEGLFAEVIRRPGLCSDIQTKHRVMMTGPTTLAALLSSLQMGFRTLAIEKRSSEVWQVLSAAKTEFRKYGEVWDKIGRQLDSAKKTVDEAGRRTRAVERKLRTVETLEAGTSVDQVLGLTAADSLDLDDERLEEVDS
jgi:DNA recombination protein RmuC